MHKLENGSQVTTRPARKPTAGTAGYFSESNDGGSPSIPGADWFNDNIDEFQNALAAAGVAYDPAKLTHLAQAFGQLTRSKFMMDVSGTADAIILTTPAGKQPVTTLNDYDEFSFIVPATNTSTVTIKVDGLAAMSLNGVVSDTQIFETALLTVRYIAGSFYIAEQINPKTGNSVLDIAKLLLDTTDILRPGEYSLNGAEISSVDHPIACAIAAASSNYIAQVAKDEEPIKYGGYYGFFDELDGSTTVTLPTVGGEFIRMFDDGRGVDDGRDFGGWNEDAFQGFSPAGTTSFGRNLGSAASIPYFNAGGGTTSYQVNWDATGANPDSLSIGKGFIVADGVNGDPRVDIETRPRSIAYYGKTRL